ncbi:SMP-30/gluconolactonase/LRE family protein [uncultured Alsobacter sp.]|uniref:IclR family transcriptional regulator domain-containing protein n=1 Tax=uncultured Alsobacter sp. TaxID=1748258 RepID=UPI0025DA6204|nr:SMP-30/gluconolactonase/LRE family protein [uncultured Alsobacter sp.]
MRKPAAEIVSIEDSPAQAGTGLVLKALNLIDLIAAAPGQHRAQTLADELGLTRSTAYRILNTLQQRGMVRLDTNSQGYFPGFKFLDYAHAVWPLPDLPLLAMSAVRALRDVTGETVYFAVPGGTDMVIIQKADPAFTPRPGAAVGSRRPLHATGMGKAWLSALPQAEREGLIGRLSLDRHTERTVVDAAQLRSQLDVFRLRGYAIEDEEFAEGRRCVAAAVVIDGVGPVGALAIAGPGFRLTQDRAHLLGPEVAGAARRLGEALRQRRDVPHRGTGASVPEFTEGTCFLGRSPLWDAASHRLMWLDALGPALMAANAAAPAAVVSWFDLPACAMARDPDGRLVVVTQAGAYAVSPDGTLEAIWRDGDPGLLARTAGMATADGAVWLAAAGVPGGAGAGLHRIEDGAVVAAVPFEGTPSGVVALPGSRQLLVAVSDTGEILRVTLPTGRQAAAVSPAFRIDPIHGRPHAIAVDPEGFIWVALWDGWSVARFRPDGSEMRLLPLPVPRPSGLAFGGPSGDVLYVTTCRMGLSPHQLTEAPASGRVFAVDRALRAQLLR